MMQLITASLNKHNPYISFNLFGWSLYIGAVLSDPHNRAVKRAIEIAKDIKLEQQPRSVTNEDSASYEDDLRSNL